MNRVYVALGTNLGHRWQNLSRAIESMRAFVHIDMVSPVYETAPWGYTDQPNFLNGVLSGQTGLAPHDLLAALKKLERALGRVPNVRYGPRVIDLDILFYDHICLDTPDLVIPHPRLHERAFVLVPLADIAPDLRHPRLNVRVVDLLSMVDPSKVWKA